MADIMYADDANLDVTGAADTTDRAASGAILEDLGPDEGHGDIVFRLPHTTLWHFDHCSSKSADERHVRVEGRHLPVARETICEPDPPRLVAEGYGDLDFRVSPHRVTRRRRGAFVFGQLDMGNPEIEVQVALDGFGQFGPNASAKIRPRFDQTWTDFGTRLRPTLAMFGQTWANVDRPLYGFRPNLGRLRPSLTELDQLRTISTNLDPDLIKSRPKLTNITVGAGRAEWAHFGQISAEADRSPISAMRCRSPSDSAPHPRRPWEECHNNVPQQEEQEETLCLVVGSEFQRAATGGGSQEAGAKRQAGLA